MTNHETDQSYVFTFQEILPVNQKTKVRITTPPNRVFHISYMVIHCDSGDCSLRWDGAKHIVENEVVLYASSIDQEIRFDPNVIAYNDSITGITLKNLSATEETINGLLIGKLIPI